MRFHGNFFLVIVEKAWVSILEQRTESLLLYFVTSHVNSGFGQKETGSWTMHCKLASYTGPVEPEGQVGQMPDQYFSVALYYSFICYYHTHKIMKFILHMWAGKSLQWILMRLLDQCFFASADPTIRVTWTSSNYTQCVFGWVKINNFVYYQ